MNTPDVRYVQTRDGAFIAFQVFGHGPSDLLFVPGFFSNLLLNWELPGMARFLARLAEFARVVVIDRRGVGLSDRVSPHDLPPLETQMEDLLAVLDAVHMPRAHLVGYEEGAELCALLAASLPERTSSLSVYALAPRVSRVEGYPFGPSPEEWDSRAAKRAALWAHGWGREAAREDYEYAAPSLATDEEQVALFARYLSLSASPGSAIAVLNQWRETDIRAVLPTIRIPTLVLIREEAPRDLTGIAHWLTATIPGARLSVLPGRDLALWAGDVDAFADEIEVFVTGVRPAVASRTVLATVLFTDIVGSTKRQAIAGDHAWRDVIQRHHALVRELLATYRGIEVDTAGDGFFATFDGPARAVRCALAISSAVQTLELEIRAGLHTGECELIDGKVGGLSVSIGARVAGIAGPSQVLVSSTVKDLVAGSGLMFEDIGEHELRGVPGQWRLFSVAGG
jgi:class 3 adenylate cyclase